MVCFHYVMNLNGFTRINNPGALPLIGHLHDVMLVSTLRAFSHIRDNLSSKQEGRFHYVDLMWWDSLRLDPISITVQIMTIVIMKLKQRRAYEQLNVMAFKCQFIIQ